MKKKTPQRILQETGFPFSHLSMSTDQKTTNPKMPSIRYAMKQLHSSRKHLNVSSRCGGGGPAAAPAPTPAPFPLPLPTAPSGRSIRVAWLFRLPPAPPATPFPPAAATSAPWKKNLVDFEF